MEAEAFVEIVRAALLPGPRCGNCGFPFDPRAIKVAHDFISDCPACRAGPTGPITSSPTRFARKLYAQRPPKSLRLGERQH